MDVTATVKCEDLFFGGGEFSVSSTVSSDWTYSTDNSVSDSYELDVPLTVPAGKVYKAYVYATYYTGSIPYTGTVHFVGSSATQTVTGTYNSVGSWELTVEVVDVTSSY